MAKLPLFDFHFINTEDIITTGLSWFWLTDGFYWMNIDNQKLFEHSEEGLRCWEKQGDTYPTENYQKCMDYQVVRFWEDMIEILPTIVQPVPSEFHNLFSQPIQSLENNYELYYDYVEKINDTAEYKENNQYFDKPFFFDNHILSTMHIFTSPLIYFWRYIEGKEDNIHIVWDFTQTTTTEDDKQIPMWSATQGHYKLAYDDFMQEFYDFHQRLIDSMEKKIIEIENSPKLQALLRKGYDLRAEHEERKKWIEKEFKKYPNKLDWEDIIYHHKQAKIL